MKSCGKTATAGHSGEVLKKGLVQGALRLLRWAYYRTQAVPQQDDVHATAGATSAARDGQCILTTKFISPCAMLCDTGDSVNVRSTPTRTIDELVPRRKRQRLNHTLSLLCRLSSKPSHKSRMTVSTAFSHVEAQFPIQGNSRPMMRLARSSFSRSCASERPKWARTNIGWSKQAQGEGTQPGV